MDFHVRAHSTHLDNDTRAYAEEKIGRAVTKVLGSKGGRVDIEVTDQNQGGGAPCSRVKVHVAIPHSASETVHVDDPDIRAAIDQCADKIGRAIKKNRGRRRDRVRTGEIPAYVPIVSDDDDDDDLDA